MHAINNKIEKAITLLVGILVIVLAVNVLFQVFFRWLKIPVVWTDEIARFSFIWMVMFAASVQVRKRMHFAVTVFSDSFKNKRIINSLSYLIILFVSWMLFYNGIRYTVLGLRKLAATMNMTMVWVYAAIPVGSALMFLFAIELLLGELWPNTFIAGKERHPESSVAPGEKRENG